MEQLNAYQKRLLLRPTEVAVELGISRALAYRWAQQGIIPTIRQGKSVRVPYDALMQWIRDRTTGGKVAA